MLPISNEKLKSKEQDKKKGFSLLNKHRHTRSQSSSTTSNNNYNESNASSTFNLENNKRGWLVEPTVVVNPSLSLDNSENSSNKQQKQQQSHKTIPTTTVPAPPIASTTANIRKPLITDLSQKDILGAVSDEDIFKLTELTSRLPEVTTSSSTKQKHYNQHHRQRSEQYDDITSRRKINLSEQQLPSSLAADVDPVTDKQPPQQQITNNLPSPSTSSPTTNTTRNSSEIHLDSPVNNESTSSSDSKRRSWLYKSLIKPYKNKGSTCSSPSSRNNEVEQQEQPEETTSNKSPAASIADEYRRTSLEQEEQQQHLTSLPITKESSSTSSNNKLLGGLSRIHSINIATSSEVLKNKLNPAKRFSNKEHHSRSNSSHVNNLTAKNGGESSTKNPSKSGRRHSFDSFQSFPILIKEKSPAASDHEREHQQEEADQELTKWDEERKKGATTFGHEERPSFNLVVSSDHVHDEMVIKEDEEEVINHLSDYDEMDAAAAEEQINTGTNTPAVDDTPDQQQAKTFMFDYYSLPVEVKSLIDAYEHKGKVERTKMTVKYEKSKDDDDSNKMTKVEEEAAEGQEDEEEDDDDYEEEDEDEDEEEEETKENTVDYKNLITGNSSSGSKQSPLQQKDIRDIAIVTTDKSDNVEFTKLIQVASTMESDENGPLLDLHVSLFGVQHQYQQEEELQDTIQSIERNIARFQSFKKESAAFLSDHINTMETLNLYNDMHTIPPPSLPRTHSYPTLHSSSPAVESPAMDTQFSDEPESISSSSSSSSSSMTDGSKDVTLRPGIEAHKENYNRHAQSMYISNTQVKTRDPFETRQKEIASLVTGLKAELYQFKDSLNKTEELVNDVQVDMDDTRNRMETYIKDIPESHYSALKKLEVDIESILSKRAKNPWLDTGYALLSYLLTLFALVVWIVIYILKWGKKVILFPKQLWKAYSDYLVERNKVVKKASIRSLAGAGATSGTRAGANGAAASSSSSSSLDSTPTSLFQRSVTAAAAAAAAAAANSNRMKK